MSDTPSRKQPDLAPEVGRGARASIVGAIVVAIAASACCLLPALLAVVGVSGVGLAAALEPYRPVLLGATAALLAIGFALVYRRPRAKKTSDDCGCDAPGKRRSGRAMLWIAAAVVALFAAYPYIAGARAENRRQGDTAVTATAQSAVLQIDGMTCPSCVGHIVDTIAATPGVAEASVSYDDETATVVYDPDRVQPDALAAAVSALDGYTAKVVPR